MYTEQDIIANYIARGYITNLSDFMNSHPELNYPDWDLADIFAANQYADTRGNLYSVPLETMVKTYVYRKDKFDELGLKPAKTMDELKENAKELTDPKGNFYGWACNAKAYQALGYEFVENWWWLYDIPHWCLNWEGWEEPGYVFSFEKFPEKPRVSQAEGGYMDSEKAFEALADYLELIKYAPPGVRTYTWDESATAIANGIVGQGLQYGDFYGLFINPEQSRVVGKIYADLPPVSRHYRSGRPIGYLNLGAWSIPAGSRNKEAAWLFIQYATAKEQVARSGPATGAPQRLSVLMSDEISRLDRELYGGYFSVIRNYRHLFVGNPPLVEHFPILEIIWTHLARAVAGEFGKVPEPASPKDTTDPYPAAKKCMLAMTEAVEKKLKEFYP
ncbi:MAG: extracellular solute-binding protein [Candidatus Bathyarchaeia archaeon]